MLLDQNAPRAVSADQVVAGFDSASSMLSALAHALHDEPAKLLGWRHHLWPLGAVIDRVPFSLRQEIFGRAGALEASTPAVIARVRAERLARWVVEQYPRRSYPAVAIGSSNGALTHLWAALGIPWIPQTLLLPVRARQDPDDLPQAANALVPLGQALLEANPTLTLHAMHDPVQDRLMLARMRYFRVKWRRLSPAHVAFLKRSLAPGGRLFVIECGQRWPVTQFGERFWFQSGAVGGIDADEVADGSARIAAYLRNSGSSRRHWDVPEVTGSAPEAEWGFEPELGDELERLSDQHGWQLQRLRFEHPQDMSEAVADLFAAWYAELGLPAQRTVIETFALIDPYRVLRSASIPFWTVFNTARDVAAARAYLKARPELRDIYVALFANGVRSPGAATVEDWRQVLAQGRSRGLLGGRLAAFPANMGSLISFPRAMERLSVSGTGPRVGSLRLAQLDALAPDALKPLSLL